MATRTDVMIKVAASASVAVTYKQKRDASRTRASLAHNPAGTFLHKSFPPIGFPLG